MDDTTRLVFAAIVELSICKNDKHIITSWNGLKLRSTLFTGEDSSLRKALDDLRDNEKEITSWQLENDTIEVSLSAQTKIPEISIADKAVVCDRAMRRSLLYRLYETYRQSSNIYARYPLVELKDNLESTKDEIMRHVLYLQNEYYLEYGVCDGGMCTTSITHEGIKLCEIKSELFRAFGTVQVSPQASDAKVESATDPRRVFVVHGRNEKARKAMFEFLRALGLSPIEWSEAISYTGTGAPYIGEVLDDAFKITQAVIVLITGDDIAKLSSQYIKPDDPDFERNFIPQARPNVLFEAGLAFGRHPERTIIVELGNNRYFSDIAGRNLIKLSNDASVKQQLMLRLKSAGCSVDINNKTDWLNAGDFDNALADHVVKIDEEIKGLNSPKRNYRHSRANERHGADWSPFDDL